MKNPNPIKTDEETLIKFEAAALTGLLMNPWLAQNSHLPIDGTVKDARRYAAELLKQHKANTSIDGKPLSSLGWPNCLPE